MSAAPPALTTSTPGISTAPASSAAPHSAANSAPRCTPRPCRPSPSPAYARSMKRRPSTVVPTTWSIRAAPARTSSSTPRRSSTAIPVGCSSSPAPTGPGSGARSRISTSWPAAREQRRRRQPGGPRSDDADSDSKSSQSSGKAHTSSRKGLHADQCKHDLHPQSSAGRAAWGRVRRALRRAGHHRPSPASTR